MKEKKINILLVLVIVLGLVLRLYALGSKSLWMDEIWSVTRSQAPLSKILVQKFSYGGASYGLYPLHYLLIHWALYFGNSEFVVRFPSAIFGTLAIFLMYQVGKIIFGKKVGLIAAFLLATSPFHLHYSQEARYYSYFSFFSLLTWLTFLKTVHAKKKIIWGVTFIGSTALNFLLHFLAFLVLMCELVAIPFFFPRELSRVSRWVKRNIFLMVTLLFIFGGITLFSAYHAFPFIKTVQLNNFKTILLSINHLINSFSGYKLANYKIANLSWLNFPVVFFTAFFLFGFLSSIKKFQRPVGFLIVGLVLSLLALFFIVPKSLGFHARHVIFLLPTWFLMISLGIVNLTQRINNLFFRRSFLLALFLVFTLVNSCLIRVDYQTPKEAWREVAHYLKSKVRSEDLIVVDAKENTLTAINFYYGDYFGGKNDYSNIKTISDSFKQTLPSLFRRYYVYHDWVDAQNPPGPGRLELADQQIEEMESFGDMYVYQSKPVAFWQEAEGEVLASDSWGISEHYQRQTRGSDCLGNPKAIVTYKFSLLRSGSYDLYANLRWDGIRGWLKSKMDGGQWSGGFRPLLGESGSNEGGFIWKEVKLGSYYLAKGEHQLSFWNFSTGKEEERFQTIDYFYLTSNE